MNEQNSAKAWFDPFTPLPFTEQLHYGFDPTGNLLNRTNNLLVQNFAVNSLNELTTNTNGGTLTVVGTTISAATNVTVNSSNALLYGDATFAATNMPLTNSYTAVAQDSYSRIATNTISVSLATNVTFQYDANGNLTNDGLRSFAYDDENQLIQVWVTNQWQSKFLYDAKMRRRIRQEFTWQSGSWIQTNAVYYVYDGNLVIQERDTNNLPTTTYTRGKDLSGSLEGAGGIGGLLARTDNSSLPTLHSYYHADGNGNVTILINSSQAIVAKYLYDAFGNILSKSGSLCDINRCQFSSKENDSLTGLTYYLYRYYAPNLQRWPNRDPLGEIGFRALSGVRIPALEANLYLMARNDCVDKVDLFGLASTTGCKICKEPGLGAHTWLECPGTSIGFYPGTGSHPLYPGGPGTIVSPDPHSGDSNKHCMNIPFTCGGNCNPQKFQQCVQNQAKQPPPWYCVLTDNCADWALDTIKKCSQQACQ